MLVLRKLFNLAGSAYAEPAFSFLTFCVYVLVYWNHPERGFLIKIKLLNFMKRLFQYIRDTKGELKHVSWPTTKQTIIFTILVIIISLFIAALLGFFDFIFTGLLNKFFI